MGQIVSTGVVVDVAKKSRVVDDVVRDSNLAGDGVFSGCAVVDIVRDSRVAFEPMADDDEVGVIQQDAPTPICPHEEKEDANMLRDAPTLVAQEKIDNSTERAWRSLARLRWCSSSWLLERILFSGLGNCRRIGAVCEAEEKGGRRQTSSRWQH